MSFLFFRTLCLDFLLPSIRTHLLGFALQKQCGANTAEGLHHIDVQPVSTLPDSREIRLCSITATKLVHESTGLSTSTSALF